MEVHAAGILLGLKARCLLLQIGHTAALSDMGGTGRAAGWSSDSLLEGEQVSSLLQAPLSPLTVAPG